MPSLVVETGQESRDWLEAIPAVSSVFLVHLQAENSRPYLGRTANLRRRLLRLFAPPAGSRRFLNLQGLARRIECYFTASRLGASLIFYQLSREHYPDDYARLNRLRPSHWVKVLLGNPFPRSTVTTQLSASQAVHYGPFRTRAAAERFEQEMLDLFQVRRCTEDLEPSPEHPGCIYGEMFRCCRPCQQVVSIDEYQNEVQRLVSFLTSGGDQLLESLAAGRDRLSEQMEFEAARRQHERYQRVEQVLRLRDGLVADLERLCGVAVLPSLEAGCVELRFFLRGQWLPQVDFRIAATGGASSLDHRLRGVVSALPESKSAVQTRSDHVSLLARWYYSSWRDGEWIPFATLRDLPYRKLVRAISRVAAKAHTSLFE
jgi:excinuclease UvrABC nuclease subunit